MRRTRSSAAGQGSSPAIRKTGRGPLLYQAAPGLICYWHDGALVLHDPFSRRRYSATPLAIALLHACCEPQPFAVIRDAFPGLKPSTVRSTLAQMTTSGMIRRGTRLAIDVAHPSSRWGPWSPAASSFHFATKDVPWASGDALQALEDALVAKASVTAPPPAIKRVPAGRELTLPRAAAQGEFRSVLLDRRTWRGFSPDPVPLSSLAELLDLTFGVQGWVVGQDGERVPLKTSPSGGGRHPIEAYVLALNVGGLPKGLYHYAPDRHRLELLRRGARPAQAEKYLGGQWWYRSAAAVVLMTAVLPRVWWRYETPRAYRSVLLDAGHVCQTFCLVATSLQLAPFCTMALADSRIERDLGIDGVEEVVLYAAGVGTRPEGGYVQWPERPPGRAYVAPEDDRAK